MTDPSKISKKRLREAVRLIDDRISVLDVVRQIGLKVVQAGSIYRTFCFYHNDSKEPNLTYMGKTGKNFVYCFACQKSATPTKLWCDYYNKTPAEAVCDLADQAGIDLKQFEGEPTGEEKLMQEMQEVNICAAAYLHDKLKYFPDVMDILRSRYSVDSINRWELGYCPDGQELFDYLTKKKRFSFNAVKGAGIRSKLFHDRIIYPLKNLYGGVVGFGARVWGRTPEEEKQKKQKDDGSEEPKYSNTYTTKIFQKSEQLYGLHIAREFVKQNDRTMLVVEGYPDVIAMHEAGFNNCVGVMSASFNITAAKSLESVGVNKILFCMDGDRAGRESTLRILKMEATINAALLEHGSSIRFYAIAVPWGVDPEEYLRDKDNIVGMKKIIKKPMSCLDFYIYNELRTNTPKSLTDKLDFIFNLRQTLHDTIKPAELKMTEKFLCDELGVSSVELLEYVKGVEYKKEVFGLEAGMIASIIADIEFREIAMEIMRADWFQGLASYLFRVIWQLHSNNDLISEETILDKLKFLGYHKHFGSADKVLEILNTKPLDNPYGTMYELRSKGRKSRVASAMNSVFIRSKVMTEQEMLRELRQQLAILEAEYT
jgi:DNA primase